MKQIGIFSFVKFDWDGTPNQHDQDDYCRDKGRMGDNHYYNINILIIFKLEKGGTAKQIITHRFFKFNLSFFFCFILFKLISIVIFFTSGGFFCSLFIISIVFILLIFKHTRHEKKLYMNSNEKEKKRNSTQYYNFVSMNT